MATQTLSRFADSARQAARDLAMVARLTRDLPGYLRAPLTLDQARAQTLRNLATREQRFLALAERAIYRHPASPYLALLRLAGCELGDLRNLVAAEGLEGALDVLAARGVYVTYDELKGRRDAVRGSTRLRFADEDFDNPLLRPHLIRLTGGSTGRPSRVGYDFTFADEWTGTVALTLAAHGVSQPRHAFWWPLPLAQMIIAARMGHPGVAWFYPVHPLPRAATLAGYLLAGAGTVAGYRFPIPQRRDLDDAPQMAAWIAEQLRSGQPLALWTMVSAGARIGAAASAAGLDLCGAAFIVVGEPVTEARRRHMEAAGVRVITRYGAVEQMALSHSCARPDAPDDVHLNIDRYGFARRPRPTIPGGPMVDALMFTTLSPSAGKITINAETGDYARVVERDCGCLLGEVGLRVHLSEIRSFEKLTGEGVTFARSNVDQILEETLPARFGGSSVDYQLAEEETPGSGTRLVLRIHPGVGPFDEDAVRTMLLAELGKGGMMAQHHADAWSQAGTIEIRRERPLATRAGKVLPLHVLKREREEAGDRSQETRSAGEPAGEPAARPYDAGDT